VLSSGLHPIVVLTLGRLSAIYPHQTVIAILLVFRSVKAFRPTHFCAFSLHTSIAPQEWAYGRGIQVHVVQVRLREDAPARGSLNSRRCAD
jgi:hypothetical protein